MIIDAKNKMGKEMLQNLNGSLPYNQVQFCLLNNVLKVTMEPHKECPNGVID
jgi:hypothetical protein